MAKLLLALIFICGTLMSEPAAAQSRGPILLTAFEPFSGRSTNQSRSAAEVAKRRLELQGYNVQLCILPVVYDRAVERAMECVNRLNPAPQAVFSMGESGCRISLETTASNRDGSLQPDNAGSVRTGTVRDSGPPPPKNPGAHQSHGAVALTAAVRSISIIDGLPDEIDISRFASSLYCSVPADVRQQVTVSPSMERYVCNNTALRLHHELRGRGIPFAFMHVPVSSCFDHRTAGARQSAETAGQVVAQMLSSSISESSTGRPRAPAACVPMRSAPAETLAGNTLQFTSRVYREGRDTNCSDEFLRRREERCQQQIRMPDPGPPFERRNP